MTEVVGQAKAAIYCWPFGPVCRHPEPVRQGQVHTDVEGKICSSGASVHLTGEDGCQTLVNSRLQVASQDKVELKPEQNLIR